ncbi:hypothetical protein ACI2JA_04110 [Alkalihalobacillus sp. NPDC078783]
MAQDLFNFSGEPFYLKNVGNIYPLKVKDYITFSTLYEPVLMMNYQHFNKEKSVDPDEPSLLELICEESANDSYDTLLKILNEIFKLALRKDVTGKRKDVANAIFKTEEGGIIHEGNYDDVRKVIMAQNLLFDPPQFKSKFKQRYFEGWLKSREGKGANITYHNYVTAVTALGGYLPEQVMDMNVYQLRSLFAQFEEIEQYRRLSHIIGHGDVPERHFAEVSDITKSPYDGFLKNEKDTKLLQDQTSS